MILFDGVHLVSTEGADELHAFARRIGLHLRWYQQHPRHPHYDVLSRRIAARALALGAVRVSSAELVRGARW